MSNHNTIEEYKALYQRMLDQNNLEGALRCLDKITELKAIQEHQAVITETGESKQLNG